MAADDRLAATLAGAKRIEGLRRRHHHGHTSNPRRDYCSADNQDWPCDVASLLGAIEAALELHQSGRVTILGSLCRRHENHRHFSITSTEADDVRACQDCAATVYSSCACCGPQVSVDRCPTRLAITVELAEKETGDER